MIWLAETTCALCCRANISSNKSDQNIGTAEPSLEFLSIILRHFPSSPPALEKCRYMSEPKPDFDPVFVTEPAHILFISYVHNHQGIMAINLACHMTLCSLLVYSYKVYFVFHYYRFSHLNFFIKRRDNVRFQHGFCTSSLAYTISSFPLGCQKILMGCCTKMCENSTHQNFFYGHFLTNYEN